MTNKTNGSAPVKRAFDYSRFDNIDISDDEDSFHPNIEKNFNIKINRTVRDRKINETEDEISELKKTLPLSKGVDTVVEGGAVSSTSEPQGVETVVKGEKIQKRIDDLERKRIWHAGNMCSTKEEKTLVGTYGDEDPKKRLIPGKDEGMKSDSDIEEYFKFKEQNKVLLNKLVDCADDMVASKKLCVEYGDLILHSPHTNTFLLLTCLEYEMAGDDKAMRRCARQSQMLAHINELARSMCRPPRDLVIRWFDAVANEGKPQARETWESDTEGFVQRVKQRAIDKLKEEAEEKRKQRDLEESFVARKANEKPASEEPEVYYKRADELEEEDITEMREAVPLVEAMKEMTKEQRMQMAPGGLDPLEVFQTLPQEMKDCFESQDVSKLVDLQKVMDKSVFNTNLVKCIKAGLWSQPLDDDEEEEGGKGGGEGEKDIIGDQD